MIWFISGLVVTWVLIGWLCCLYWQVKINKYMDMYWGAFGWAALNGPFEWLVGRGIYKMFHDNPMSYLLWMERQYGKKRGKV